MTSEEKIKYEKTAIEIIRAMAIGAEYDTSYIPAEKYIEISLDLSSGRGSSVYIYLDTYRTNETIELDKSILELWGNKQYVGVQQVLDMLAKTNLVRKESSLKYVIQNTDLMNAFSKIEQEKEKLIKQFVLKAANNNGTN